MTREIVSICPLDLMTKVADIFETQNIHHLPVLDERGVAVGMISRHDYCQLQHHFTRNGWELAEASNNRLFSSLTAKEVMSDGVVTMSEDNSTQDAIDYFLQNRIHSIIITDENNVCIGIVTPYDILDETKRLVTLLR